MAPELPKQGILVNEEGIYVAIFQKEMWQQCQFCFITVITLFLILYKQYGSSYCDVHIG